MSAYRTAIRESQRIDEVKAALEEAWRQQDYFERLTSDQTLLIAELSKRFRGLLQRYERAKGWKDDVAVKRGNICFNLVMLQAKERCGLRDPNERVTDVET